MVREQPPIGSTREQVRAWLSSYGFRPDYYAVPWRGRWDTELGGVLVSQAVHALDMLTYIVGPPARLFARLETMVNDIEVEDCAAISLAIWRVV